jgi:hypothetical protein
MPLRRVVIASAAMTRFAVGGRPHPSAFWVVAFLPLTLTQGALLIVPMIALWAVIGAIWAFRCLGEGRARQVDPRRVRGLELSTRRWQIGANPWATMD